MMMMMMTMMTTTMMMGLLNTEKQHLHGPLLLFAQTNCAFELRVIKLRFR